MHYKRFVQDNHHEMFLAITYTILHNDIANNQDLIMNFNSSVELMSFLSNLKNVAVGLYVAYSHFVVISTNFNTFITSISHGERSCCLHKTS